MKRTSSILFVALILATLGILFSCSKDEENLKGSVVFWYGKVTADSLIADGAASLSIYVDGKVVGSYATNVYFTSDPDCGQHSTVTVEKELGDKSSITLPYNVKDNTGFEYWNGNVEFEANTCNSVELAW
jgi:hypothetical protein